MRVKSLFYTLLISLVYFISPALVGAEEKKPVQTLFTNVNIFDGKADKLAMGMNVLVEGNLIKQVGKNVKGRDDVKTIDGGGRTLMPGLHDMHTHVGIFRPVAGVLRTDMSPFLLGAGAAARVEGMLPAPKKHIHRDGTSEPAR